jgi:hypothetical protein
MTTNEGICPRCIWGKAPCSIRDEAIVLSSCAHFLDREKKEMELADKMERLIGPLHGRGPWQGE